MGRKKKETVTEETNTPVETVTKETTVAEPVKKSAPKFLLPCIIGVACVLVIAALVAVKVITSAPKQAFAKAITNTYKDVSDALKEMDSNFDPAKEAIEFSASMKIDTDMDLKELMDIDEDIKLSDMELEGSVGFDLPNKEMLLSAGIKGAKDKVSAKIYGKDKDVYLETSFYDKVIKFKDEFDMDDIDELTDMLDEADFDISLYDDILEAFSKALIKSLDPDAMSKESDEIDVLDDEIKVTRNSYRLKEKDVQKIVKGLASNLLDNKKFIENLSKATGEDKSDIKDALKQMKEQASEISFEETIVINVYTKGLLNKVVGFDLGVGKEKVITYYTNGDNIEAVINSGTKIKITVEAEKKEKNVKVTVDGEKVATAKVRSFEEEKIDFDFTLYDDDEEVSGTIYLTRKKSKKSVEGEYKFKIEYEKQSATVSGDYKIEAKDKLDGVKTSDTIDSEKVDEEEFANALKKAVESDEVLSKIAGELIKEAGIGEIKPSELNYYDMKDIKVDEALKILSSTSPKVLYVGYNYYSASDPYYMFKNLIDAQDELDFNSYALSELSVDEAFKAAIANVEFTCKQTTETAEGCSEWPAIFLIKDGKVVKAYRGTVDKEELKQSLKDLGM